MKKLIFFISTMGTLMGMNPALEMVSVPAAQLPCNPFIPRLASFLSQSIVADALMPSCVCFVKPLTHVHSSWEHEADSMDLLAKMPLSPVEKKEVVAQPTTLFSLMTSLIKKNDVPLLHISKASLSKKTYEQGSSHKKTQVASYNLIGQWLKLLSQQPKKVMLCKHAQTPSNSYSCPSPGYKKYTCGSLSEERNEFPFSREQGNGALVDVQLKPLVPSESLDLEGAFSPIITSLNRIANEQDRWSKPIIEELSVNTASLDGILSDNFPQELKHDLECFNAWAEKNKCERERVVAEIGGKDTLSVIPQHIQKTLRVINEQAREYREKQRVIGILKAADSIAHGIIQKPQEVSWENLSQEHQDLLNETVIC